MSAGNMVAAELIRGTNDSVLVTTVQGLAAALESFAAGAHSEPPLVELVTPEGARLDIGLGTDQSVTSSIPSSFDPPYFISVGQEVASPATEVTFTFCGERSSFSSRNLIPTHIAIKAACHFFETGTLAPFVRWERS